MTRSAPSPARMTCRRLPDGSRLHLSDGPIDLILDADGAEGARAAAFAAASRRFASILDELCAELPALRRPATPGKSIVPALFHALTQIKRRIKRQRATSPALE